MAYTAQTFVVGAVLTAAQMNQVETNIKDHPHGSAGIDTVDINGLNKAQGTASGTANGVEVTVNQYAFSSPAITTKGITAPVGAVAIGYEDSTGQTDVRRWLIDYGAPAPASATTITWDYLTASGWPFLWAEVDGHGNWGWLTWESEDPVDKENPDLVPMDYPLPSGHSFQRILMPEKADVLSAIRAERTRDAGYHPKAMTRWEKMLGSRGLPELQAPDELFDERSDRRRDWMLMLLLRAMEKERSGHQSMVFLAQQFFQVDLVTGQLVKKRA